MLRCVRVGKYYSMYEQNVEQIIERAKENNITIHQRSVDGFLNSRFNHMQLDNITYSDGGNIVIRKNNGNIDAILIEFVDEKMCYATAIDI